MLLFLYYLNPGLYKNFRDYLIIIEILCTNYIAILSRKGVQFYLTRYGIRRRIKLNDRGRTVAGPCAQGQLKLAAEIAAHPDEERILIQPEGLEQGGGSAEKELLVMVHIDSSRVRGTRQIPGVHTISAAGEDKAHTLARADGFAGCLKLHNSTRARRKHPVTGEFLAELLTDKQVSNGHTTGAQSMQPAAENIHRFRHLPLEISGALGARQAMQHLTLDIGDKGR
jgi:hypothetical protein